MSACFNPLRNPNQTFCVQIKPQFSDFFLKKTVLSSSGSISNDNDHFKENGGTQINGGPEGPFVWSDLSETHGGQWVLSGVVVMVKTVLAVTKQAVVRFRIRIERIEEEQKELKSKSSSCSNVGNLKMVKGMCLWMSREAEVLQKDNRDMRKTAWRRLGEMVVFE
ncbi:hypothetical protein NE237_016858 [Protea cynaroides]|uniref:Uncharacterized protein n=1 Tax=Protea cynaroides TaxID=273540 RepID=A0A9Q0HFL4_9MAGN|nr:hypothetical protein NE237_016858 [Protea cynaroides]